LTSEGSAAGSWNQLFAPHHIPIINGPLIYIKYTRFAEVILARSERQVAIDGFATARRTNPLNTLM
jgi:hypothetical protein